MGLIFDDRGFPTDFARTEDRIAFLEDDLRNHMSYVRYLIDTYNLWSPEGTFTFPNGDTFHKNG